MNEKRDSMIFPFRWMKSLSKLNDAEFRAMISDIVRYAADGVAPEYSGALGAIWEEYRQRIDYDREKYESICQRNRSNGMSGGRPPKQNNPKNPLGYLGTQRNPKKPKKPDAGADADAEKKESILTDTKENVSADASLFSLPPDSPDKPIHQSAMLPGPNFKKWTLEQFKRSVDDAIEQKPEHRQHRDNFIAYWTEPDAKGRYRFAIQRTWETARRLKTWHDRNQTTGSARGNDCGPQSDDEYKRRVEEERRRNLVFIERIERQQRENAEKRSIELEMLLAEQTADNGGKQ